MEAIERIILNIRTQLNNYFPVSVRTTIDSVNKSISNIKVPPFTKENVLYYYIPIQGLVSYTTLSVAVMNPRLMVSLFPKRDITDVLFLASGGGAALWLWSRPHMAGAAPMRRASWSLLGGCLWPLGSIFMWAILRNSLGKKTTLGTFIGIGTGAVFTNIAIDYFRYVELMFCGEIQLPEDTYSPQSDDEKYDIDI